MQRIKVDGLGLTMVVVVIALLGAALGQADIDPVGGLIAGAWETAPIHKGFSQIQGMTIGLLPIATLPPQIEG